MPGLAASLAVVLGFLAAWWTGLFEARSKELKVENALLEMKKREFEASRDVLQEELEQLRREIIESKWQLASAPLEPSLDSLRRNFDYGFEGYHQQSQVV